MHHTCKITTPLEGGAHMRINYLRISFIEVKTGLHIFYVKINKTLLL